MASRDPVGQDLVRAAVKLLAEEGAAALTVRRVADAAGVSTMAVYSRFGGMASLLDAVYVHGFSLLEDAMRPDEPAIDPREDIDRLGLAYRRFALSNPALFSLMFERPLPGFDPSDESRTTVLEATFGILEDAVERAQAADIIRSGDPRRLGFLIWVGVHGAVALEATYTSRSPLSKWFINGDADGSATVLSVIATTLAGLEDA